MAAHLNESARRDAIPNWTSEWAKDVGLDVVCHMPFPDKRSGRPVLYVQCASGENWEGKRGTPNIRQWDQILELVTKPTRGISVPFVFLEPEFRRAATYDELSLFLDRHRLSAPVKWNSQRSTWVSTQLRTELNNWTKSRLAALSLAKR